jgi:phenylpropionate dioxygenase-like ring-hydroxylating dioxygenase large terminal subunit
VTVLDQPTFDPSAEPPLAVPPQGVDGFNESWYPICTTEELTRGAVLSVVFLHGRVVAWRGEDGAAHVTSPFCPHLGADLQLGTVIGANLRCVFHHWQFDGTGTCVETPKGDAVPERAKLFSFPTVERWGLVWAFNGSTPTFELPDLSVPDEELAWKVDVDDFDYPVDPYVMFSNSMDFSHLEAVHGLVLISDPNDVEIDTLKIDYRQHMRHALFGDMQQHVRIFGSNVFSLDGTMGPMHVMAVSTGRPTTPGHCVNYSVSLTRNDGTPEEVSGRLDMMEAFARELVKDDKPIMATIRVRPAALTRSDHGLRRYFAYARGFPRNSEAVPYISV